MATVKSAIGLNNKKNKVSKKTTIGMNNTMRKSSSLNKHKSYKRYRGQGK